MTIFVAFFVLSLCLSDNNFDRLFSSRRTYLLWATLFILFLHTFRFKLLAHQGVGTAELFFGFKLDLKNNYMVLTTLAAKIS